MPELENHMVLGDTDGDLARFYGEWPENEDGEPVEECNFKPGQPCTRCHRCEPEYDMD